MKGERFTSESPVKGVGELLSVKAQVQSLVLKAETSDIRTAPVRNSLLASFCFAICTKPRSVRSPELSHFHC